VFPGQRVDLGVSISWRGANLGLEEEYDLNGQIYFELQCCCLLVSLFVRKATTLTTLPGL